MSERVLIFDVTFKTKIKRPVMAVNQNCRKLKLNTYIFYNIMYILIKIVYAENQ